MAESTCKFYLILCTTCLNFSYVYIRVLTLVKYISMLEGLNKIFFFCTIIETFIPGCYHYLLMDRSLNAVKLRIYGSSVIKITLREPRFPDNHDYEFDD